MGNSHHDKELEKAYNDLKKFNKEKNKPRNDLLQFFIGLLMLGAGLFMVFQNIIVTSSFGSGGSFLRIGDFGIPNGMVFLPILIGIAMLFIMDRKIFGWITLSIGIVIVIAAILMSTNIHWRTTNGYIFIVIFGLVFAGGGLVIRQLFKKD